MGNLITTNQYSGKSVAEIARQVYKDLKGTSILNDYFDNIRSTLRLYDYRVSNRSCDPKFRFRPARMDRRNAMQIYGRGGEYTVEVNKALENLPLGKPELFEYYLFPFMNEFAHTKVEMGGGPSISEHESFELIFDAERSRVLAEYGYPELADKAWDSSHYTKGYKKPRWN